MHDPIPPLVAHHNKMTTPPTKIQNEMAATMRFCFPSSPRALHHAEAAFTCLDPDRQHIQDPSTTGPHGVIHGLHAEPALGGRGSMQDCHCIDESLKCVWFWSMTEYGRGRSPWLSVRLFGRPRPRAILATATEDP